MRTFAVDDVDFVLDRLPTVTRGSLHEGALTWGGDASLPVLPPDGVHPLLGAVAQAFAEHRPLTLSPDAVWLTITQGLAQHVRLNAEELRSTLVRHEGRRRLTLRVDGPMPDDPALWTAAVHAFSDQLATEVEDLEWFACDFSTSSAVDLTASHIVAMDVYAPYFSFGIHCVCGIPALTLTGTVTDWQRIRHRIERLPEVGLESWHRSLAPILDQCVRASSGDVDVAFWRRIYNPADAYGGEVITGWAARLYPYLLRNGKVDRPNPLLDLPIDEPRDLTDPTQPGRMGYSGPGIRSDDVPATLARATVDVADQVTGTTRAVALHGGLVAVTQDAKGALAPVAGWHLTLATPDVQEVADRIAAEHHATPPTSTDQVIALPEEVVALYARIGSADLFDGAWRILPVDEQRSAVVEGLFLLGIAELPDGRTLAAVTRSFDDPPHWITCRLVRSPQPSNVIIDDRPMTKWILQEAPSTVPVYGTSLGMLLTAVLDEGGIAHLQTGLLADVPRATDDAEVP